MPSQDLFDDRANTRPDICEGSSSRWSGCCDSSGDRRSLHDVLPGTLLELAFEQFAEHFDREIALWNPLNRGKQLVGLHRDVGLLRPCRSENSRCDENGMGFALTTSEPTVADGNRDEAHSTRVLGA